MALRGLVLQAKRPSSNSALESEDGRVIHCARGATSVDALARTHSPRARLLNVSVVVPSNSASQATLARTGRQLSVMHL